VRIYFVFYILLIGIYIFKRRDDEESQKKANIRAAIFAFLGLTLLMGLKADYIGIDTGNYINKYMFAERLMQNIEKNGEYGYVYFMNFFKQICGFGWRRYIFSVALIIYACNISFFYKYSKNVALTVDFLYNRKFYNVYVGFATNHCYFDVFSGIYDTCF